VSLSLLLFAVSAWAGKAEHVMNDGWYVMQAGSTGWGYFHEVIVAKEGKIFYRYDMTKRENDHLYQENLGAVAAEDLTPVAFNLNKSGQEVAESYSGSYQDKGDSGMFSVQVSGAREKSFKRYVRKETIMEAYFPIWIHKNWDRIKKDFRGSVPIFTEDPQNAEYQVRTAKLEWKGDRLGATPCKELNVEFDGRRSVWCVEKSGALVTMVIGDNEVIVRRVASEKEAKKALGGH
jgi:hypothetical protein